MSRWDKIIVAVWLVCVIAIAGNIYSATNFPTTLDSWTDQTAADLITSAKWNKLQDAIGALEVKVGADSSAVTTTVDHKLTDEIAATANLRSTLGVSPMPDWVRTIAVNAHSSGVSKADLVRLNATTSSAAELNVLDGISATLTASELSILDGVTSTASEINAINTGQVDNLPKMMGWIIINGANSTAYGSGGNISGYSRTGTGAYQINFTNSYSDTYHYAYFALPYALTATTIRSSARSVDHFHLTAEVAGVGVADTDLYVLVVGKQ